jgi:hypothetical protein
MTPRLRQYLNRIILVAVPAIFSDGRCHPYTLHAIEEDGLWLASDALLDRLCPDHESANAVNRPLVYVPSAQIAALILPALSSTVTPQNANEARSGTPATPKSA